MIEKLLGHTITVESWEYISTLQTHRLGGGTSCPASSTETVHKMWIYPFISLISLGDGSITVETLQKEALTLAA